MHTKSDLQVLMIPVSFNYESEAMLGRFGLVGTIVVQYRTSLE